VSWQSYRLATVRGRCCTFLLYAEGPSGFQEHARFPNRLRFYLDLLKCPPSTSSKIIPHISRAIRDLAFTVALHLRPVRRRRSGRPKSNLGTGCRRWRRGARGTLELSAQDWRWSSRGGAKPHAAGPGAEPRDVWNPAQGTFTAHAPGLHTGLVRCCGVGRSGHLTLRRSASRCCGTARVSSAHQRKGIAGGQ
jgi:hypothetical protein